MAVSSATWTLRARRCMVRQSDGVTESGCVRRSLTTLQVGLRAASVAASLALAPFGVGSNVETPAA